MPREARIKSTNGTYHILISGVNRQPIFCDNDDYKHFLSILKDCKTTSGFLLYGYCLMENHAHLLIKEGAEALEQIVKRIGSRYVTKFNYKHMRSGQLFHDRFKSEPVDTDAYFMPVLRFIHQNPYKAKLCEELDDYPWSSYGDYVNKTGITDTEFAIGLIGEKLFFRYMNVEGKESALELKDQAARLSDAQLCEIIKAEHDIEAAEIQNQPRGKKHDILRELLKIDGVSTRQLARVTGVPPHVIWRL